MEGAGALNSTVTLTENPSSAGAHRFGMNPKLVDTRTFTRPKKQLQQQQTQPRPFLNETMVMSDRTRQLSESSNGTGSGTGINLQIGGLVTMANKALPIAMTQSSMQKSLIGDTSPPSSICSSTIDLGAERMMISTGGVVNETYLNGGGDKTTTYNGYNMDDVQRDLEMLQNLTFDDFGVDNKTTTTTGNTGENVEATILISRPAAVNETFDGVQNHQLKKIDNNGQANGTFDLIGDEGGTCGQTVIIAEEEDEENSTFNLTKLVKAIGEEEAALEDITRDVPPPAAGLTTTVIEEDEIHLDFRRDEGECGIPAVKR